MANVREIKLDLKKSTHKTEYASSQNRLQNCK